MWSLKAVLVSAIGRLLRPAGLICLLVVAACDIDDGPLEEAGAELDEAYEESVGRIEQASDAAKDSMERIDDATQSFIHQASDSAEDSMERIDDATQSFRGEVNEVPGSSEAEIRDAQTALERETESFIEKAGDISERAQAQLETLAEGAVSNSDKSASEVEDPSEK